VGKHDDGRLRPLTPQQRITAGWMTWYREWLLANGRTEAEIDGKKAGQ
jgi:hypothetical protein